MLGIVGAVTAQPDTPTKSSPAATTTTPQVLLTNLPGAQAYTGLGTSLGNSRGEQASSSAKAFSVTIGASPVTVTGIDVYLRSRDTLADAVTGGIYADGGDKPGTLLIPFARFMLPGTTATVGSTTTPARRYTLSIGNAEGSITLAAHTRYWVLLSGAVYNNGAVANATPVWSSPLPAAAPVVPAGGGAPLVFNGFKSSANSGTSWVTGRTLNAVEIKGYVGVGATLAVSVPPVAASATIGTATSALVSDALSVTLYHKLVGHSEYVNSVAFSPDGMTIASGGRDKTVRLWDTTTGMPKSLLWKHDAAVSSVAFSPDGHSLASGGWDHKIRLFDLGSGEEISEGKFDKNTNFVLSLAFNPNGRRLASGSNDKTARAFSVATGVSESSGTLPDAIASVAYSPDGSRIAGACLDGSLYIWDAGTMHLLNHLTPAHGVASAASFFSVTFLENDLVAGGSKDGTVTVWSLPNGANVATLAAGKGEVYGLAYNPRKHLLASGGADKLIRLWSLSALRAAKGGNVAPLASIAGHTNTIRAVTFNQAGDLLVSGGWDYNVLVWHVAGGGK